MAFKITSGKQNNAKVDESIMQKIVGINLR